ncbi:HEPN domain-containing protein [Bradyrhizobium iriomotense]|uniref:HEPN domain-containing protein n=1 Tax=Bradyrhizobium iriomotense TaxID=441950 RepID=UPI001B8A0EB9|nr:HEPN domain-containing protein [Bradyrhizobium iriomotense]MBR1131714.1 HEPN domain-containing protein [Bradyrhizobium iriomotense]
MSHERATFLELAQKRLDEARLLLVNGFPSGAYYLSGYAIECALKAIIAAQFRANEIPDRRLVERVYVHDLSKLLSLSGLEDELEVEMEGAPGLREAWSTITKWSERARYEIWTQEAASAMLEAVGGDQGLLRWLQSRP